MKSSTALKKARELLAIGDAEYLCVALDEVGGSNTLVYRNLKDIFMNYSTVEMWLGLNCPEAATVLSGTSGRAHTELLRAYRLRWVDWLIPQYSAIGD